MVERLSGHQNVIRSNRFAGGLESRPHGACRPGIGIFEGKHDYGTSEERFEAFPIEFLSCALSDTVPEFENCNRRHENQGATGGRLLQPRSDCRRTSIDQGDASVGIEKVIHNFSHVRA